MKLFTNVAVNKKTRALSQRVKSTAIWWGIPAMVLEFVGIPWRLWPYVLLLALPGTVLAVLFGAVVEHLALSKSEQ